MESDRRMEIDGTLTLTLSLEGRGDRRIEMSIPRLPRTEQVECPTDTTGGVSEGQGRRK
jgi:hypothetical protein